MLLDISLFESKKIFSGCKFQFDLTCRIEINDKFVEFANLQKHKKRDHFRYLPVVNLKKFFFEKNEALVNLVSLLLL